MKIQRIQFPEGCQLNEWAPFVFFRRIHEAIDGERFSVCGLYREGELSGRNGVARSSTTSSKWTDAETLFRNSGNTMATLRAAMAEKA